MGLAVAVDILEEVLAGQVLAAFDDPRRGCVGDRQGALDAALPLEAHLHGAAGHLGMAVAQGGRAVALILLGIGLVADADAADVEQADHGRDHGVAAQRALPEIGLDPLPELRQRLAKAPAAIIFRRLLLLAEAGVIAILLAALVVIADRLDVAVRVRAEPGVAISGRQADRVEAVDSVAVGDAFPPGVEILPIAAMPLPGDPRPAVVHIMKSWQPFGHATV